MNATIPYDWLKSIPPELLKLDDIPLLGNPPSFPWESFSSLFAKQFELTSFRVEPGEIRWRTEEELTQGLGDDLHPLHIAVSAFEGRLCWLMTENDIAWMASALLHKGSNVSPEPLDSPTQEGFYRFFALEVVHLFSLLEFDKTLTPHLLKDVSMPSGPSLCMDIKITLNEHTLWGRLVMSPEFRKAWKEHYAQRKLSTSLSQALAQKIEIELSLEAGKTFLSLETWKSIKAGDFVLLDHCSVEPGEEKSRIWITLNGNSLFRGKVKGGNVKILESPLYHEVYATMAKSPENHEEDEVEKDEFEEMEGEEDLDLEEEEESEEEGTRERDAELEPDIFAEEKEEESPNPSEPSHPPAKARKPLTPEELTVPLTIEVGRIQISVQKLMELQPGNLLELDVKPENGVDLVVNGKCVGKGELLRVGEALGVRILDLG